MPAMLIRHHVADYATWLAVFDEQRGTRRANGSRGEQIYRNADNPREVLVLLAWDDLERARLFADADDLWEVMTRAGVIDRPDIWFLEEGDPLVD